MRDEKRQGIPYDAMYKACFTNPRMVEDLLREFTDKEIAAGMDFSTLKPYPAEFVNPWLGTMRGDCIWKLKFQGNDCYVLVLIEFQSSVDRFMALRVLAYVSCLWLHIMHTEKLGSNSFLPPVFPIVIYNGKPLWNAPLNFLDLIGNLPDNLRPYQGLQYYLLDIGRIAENLVSDGKGCAATLMRLERAKTVEDFLSIIGELGKLRISGYEDLYEKMKGYFTVQAKRTGLLGEVVEHLKASQVGENNMLFENLQELVANLRAEGRDAERKENLINMIREKLPFAQISRIMGLSEQEVEQIARDNGLFVA